MENFRYLTFLYHHLCGAPSRPPKPFRSRTVCPTTRGAPATTTVSDWWSSTRTFHAPTTWATQTSASPSTNATQPSRPACPSWFRSRSSIPNLGCPIPILHCPASCTSTQTERWRFRGSETQQVHREGSKETQIIYLLVYHVLRQQALQVQK